MERKFTRRDVTKGAIFGAAMMGLRPVLAQQKMRDLQIGHTGITWPSVEQAVKDVGELRFYGFETFGGALEEWEPKGGLRILLEKKRLPLISVYCSFNLTDSSRQKEAVDMAVRWGKILKNNGGRVVVLGPNGVDRAAYNFLEHKENIVRTLNETAKAVTDLGLTAVLHQHTGTCVESRDETYAVLEAVDTRYVKFGPDIGQLTKGGSDAVKVVRDFLPLVEHMHLKDYNGVDPHLLGYCPLGQGKVDIPAILDLVATKKIHGMIMGELDNDPQNWSPTPPVDLVKASKSYLKTIGIRFRA
jgi:inosose dehydratase